jgi:hypothetical protein
MLMKENLVYPIIRGVYPDPDDGTITEGKCNGLSNKIEN